MAVEKKNNVVHRSLKGEVISAKGNKTIHVLVKNKVTHPKYHKQYTVTKKYAVHDELGLAKAGDKILFQECRPLSKTKRWRLVNIEKKA
ncbi:MAG: 30S ribosomal protein S17 [Candidatus Magasanikbacteria bacterium GW2011_GWC2_37_14]|uniref:Small ribosomal subunit protein uS17 n=1 Tax=Candidatus Magasanikbacteria bacterium GW2011_GWC2_37_14 TaxID=1619046 RepID=A0A0G0G7Q9_9BACT|nr:MAG: 30S ribosomal protein S17 [Candidatus Magasanikbacteria bacterium GW2011_GWC2_37_14]